MTSAHMNHEVWVAEYIEFDRCSAPQEHRCEGCNIRIGGRLHTIDIGETEKAYCERCCPDCSHAGRSNSVLTRLLLRLPASSAR